MKDHVSFSSEYFCHNITSNVQNTANYRWHSKNPSFVAISSIIANAFAFYKLLVKFVSILFDSFRTLCKSIRRFKSTVWNNTIQIIENNRSYGLN